MSYIVYELKDASRLELIGSNSFVLLCTYKFILFRHFLFMWVCDHIYGLWLCLRLQICIHIYCIAFYLCLINVKQSNSQSLPIGRKSQDAAVGVLVHMLKTAPPLRQDPSYSSDSMKIELEGGVTSASGFFMPRKSADALEDLRSYREMKDLLLSKSRTLVFSKDETWACCFDGFVFVYTQKYSS